MPFAVVTIETETGEKVEFSLPLDQPSRALAARVMRDLGKSVKTGEAFDLYIKTGHTDKLILPTATLAELGITDGQQLRIKREVKGVSADIPAAHAFLRTTSGDLLALEASNVIIGRKDAQLQAPLDLDLSTYDPLQAMSRRHACIGRQGNEHYLIDLESTNGTRLNGRAVIPGAKLPLHDGDTIEFALRVRVTFVSAKPAV